MNPNNNTEFKDPYKTEKKTSFAWRKPVIYGFIIVMAFISVRSSDLAAESLGINNWLMILIDWLTLVLFCALGMILHCVGKLVFSLLAGMQTALFTFGPVSLVRDKGLLVKKKLPPVFRFGQCIMTPKADKTQSGGAWFWYYAGGGVSNIIAALLSAAVFFLSDNAVARWLAMTSFFAMAIIAMVYLIPSEERVPNEGMTLLRLCKDPQARIVAHNTLLMTGMEFDGVRDRDIPEELFVGADPNGASPYCDLAVTKALHLVDCGRFSEAKQLFDVLFFNESVRSNIVLFSETKLNITFCIMMLGNDFSALNDLMDEATLKYVHNSSAYSIMPLRALYAYYLIACHDTVKAEEIYTKALGLRDSCISSTSYEDEMKNIEWLRAGRTGPSPFGQ